ncbi:glycosyltransferase family 4 protein [Pseudomonas huanghezhanensis]|uniref:glycosyltransferase family 4 protein n=1 Tax=Pseudomonas huanghezhanensis TaxID=3002903 RepID=UPI002286B43D|nr:glycosyltransferase family 4 protein [Pseudomonas sp. BSw22131]
MKIVHIVRQFYPSVGGLEDYVLNLAKEQRSAGHEVVVMTLNSDFQTGKQLVEHEEHQGIKVLRLPWKGSKRYPICKPDPALLNQMDLVHVHAVDFFIDYISLLKRLGRITSPLILCTHGGFFHTKKNQWIKKLFFNVITRWTLGSVDAVVCNSSNDYSVFAPISRRAQLVNNGIRVKKFGPGTPSGSAPANDLVYLGRFSENKRLPWLIEQFAKIEHPPGHLKVIGRSKTGDAAELISLVKRLGCEEKVKLIFDVEDDEIASHIVNSKFTVSASEYEGFGLGVVELMSYGLVPFLSEEPLSFKDFVDDSGVGRIFNITSSNFKAEYDLLVGDWSPAAAVGAASYANQFSWITVAEEIFNVYETTLENSVRAYR